ncbi:MAG: hypothetical protein M9908_06985 [Phyllobacteriaceae bacterium]|nr:hypothetical protein [Phyllobacteriaceae bacterium]
MKPHEECENRQQTASRYELRPRYDRLGDLVFIEKNETAFKIGFPIVFAPAIPGAGMQIGLQACAVVKPVAMIRRKALVICVVFP